MAFPTRAGMGLQSQQALFLAGESTFDVTPRAPSPCASRPAGKRAVRTHHPWYGVVPPWLSDSHPLRSCVLLPLRRSSLHEGQEKRRRPLRAFFVGPIEVQNPWDRVPCGPAGLTP